MFYSMSKYFLSHHINHHLTPFHHLISLPILILLSVLFCLQLPLCQRCQTTTPQQHRLLQPHLLRQLRQLVHLIQYPRRLHLALCVTHSHLAICKITKLESLFHQSSTSAVVHTPGHVASTMASYHALED